MNVNEIAKKPGVYKITNTVNGYCYIGSSRNVKQRVWLHMAPSQWKFQPENPLYVDMQKYGLDKFEAEVLEYCDVEKLKEMEQCAIEKLKPEYNRIAAKSKTVYKPARMSFQSNIILAKKRHVEANKKYYSQVCIYEGKEYSLKALECKLHRMGIPHATIEAKKYLVS